MMRDVPISQLTLSLEPSLPEKFDTLLAYIAHRIDVQVEPAKTIAAKMDLSPSVLSRKLHPGDSDTQRFNLDDLEDYLRVTGDASAIIEYIAAKYLGGGDEARKARMIAQAGDLAAQLARIVATFKDGAK
jgi:hypothetical protein